MEQMEKVDSSAMVEATRNRIGRFGYSHAYSNDKWELYISDGETGNKMRSILNSNTRAIQIEHFSVPPNHRSIYLLNDCAVKIECYTNSSSVTIFNQDPSKRKETLKALEDAFK